MDCDILRDICSSQLFVTHASGENALVGFEGSVVVLTSAQIAQFECEGRDELLSNITKACNDAAYVVCAMLDHNGFKSAVFKR